MVTQNDRFKRYDTDRRSQLCACYRGLVLPPLNQSMELPNMIKVETKDLQQLLGLIKTPASKQQLPSIHHEAADVTSKSVQWPAPQPKSGSQQTLSSEAHALQQFSTKYHAERNFSRHAQHARFLEVFSALVKQRLCNGDWMGAAPPENILRVLMCLRIMMRDSTYQKHFFDLGGVKLLSEHFEKATSSYLTYGDGPCVVDILKEMTNIFQKLSSVIGQQDWLIACGAHKSLVFLLSSNDVIVLHCSLLALICLAQSAQPRLMIGELNCVEQLLRIIQEYDNVSKKHAASLLGLLCQDVQTREMVKLHDGVPILLSQLVTDNANMLYQVVWCLATLCIDPDVSKDIRQMGGIPLLLSLLHDRTFVTERNETSGCASASMHGRSGPVDDKPDWDMSPTYKEPRTKAEEFMELQYKLKQACCGCLAELVLNDTNAQQIVQANGIYSIGLLILPPCASCSSREKKASQLLQRFAFRALRFLFSMERNRRLFKKLFPTKLYTMFIDIGHYNRDLSAYKHLVQSINSLSDDVVAGIHDNILEMNQNRTPTHYIKDYAVFEHLGSGAFGSVYKVKKRGGQSFLALKEVNLLNPEFGKNTTEREKSVGNMIAELSIMRQDMRHPNIVRYHKTFREGDTLFILMDLIEGAPLNEYFNSLKEKREKFSEARIWNILIQMVLALRYLHKEKGIVHRDLKPNNIMIGENDKVTITDFGLAKVKGSDTSKMMSQCGTILYQCPEMVEGDPYGEKADVWALGCVLYQMCNLAPPFFNNNMLTLVKSIVEGRYEPITDHAYSTRLKDTIKSCICPSASKRPDIVQLASQISDIMLKHMDTLQTSQYTLERKLERERKRTQKHFVEANQNMQNYHRLFLVSQERYDKLANLAGSGGASGIKDTNMNDSAFDSQMSPSMNSIEDAMEQGWSTDEDMFPSSGSESRESSAGSCRGSNHSTSRRNRISDLPPTPAPRNKDVYSQQLSVDIPTNAKASRDSGFGSGDPSPIHSHSSSAAASLDVNGHVTDLDSRQYFRSNSTPTANGPNGRGKKKTKSANTATLTISHRRVRQISDPITQMLHILHKIIYISQLPPTLNPNPKRRVIERFKRALFSPQSSSFNLKGELHKLNMGSREVMDLNIGPVEQRINSAGSDLSLSSVDSGRRVGSAERHGSSSSLGSMDNSHETRTNSVDRRGNSVEKISHRQRRRESQSQSQRANSSDKHHSSRSSSKHRAGSAGSDSDGSLQSTLKATVSSSGLNSTLTTTLKADTANLHINSVFPSSYEYDDSITYEQLQSMIETVLVESGYYSVSPQGRERTPPLASISSDPVIRSRLLASSHFS